MIKIMKYVYYYFKRKDKGTIMIKVTAVGRLTKDATVFTYGKDNKSGINFAIACNQQGSEEAIFISCTKFGSDEKLAKYLIMGNQIIVHGDLNINKGQDDNYYTKIIVSELEFGAKKMFNNNSNYSNIPDYDKKWDSEMKPIDDGDIPF